jgi:hypothetical protein
MGIWAPPTFQNSRVSQFYLADVPGRKSQRIQNAAGDINVGTRTQGTTLASAAPSANTTTLIYPSA